MITATDVLNVIVSGQMDKNLEEIDHAVRLRFRALRDQENLSAYVAIQKGDKVKITAISPKYLIGCVVKVTGKRDGKLLVDFEKNDWMAGKFAGHKGVQIPPSSVEKVE